MAKCRSLEGRLLLRKSPAKTVLVDSESPDLRFERRARNVETRRRSRRPRDPSAARAERAFDDGLFVSGERSRQRPAALARRTCRQPALVDREFVGVADDYR